MSEDKDKITMNSWIGFTLSGLVGFTAALVTVTVTFTDVRHNASAGMQRATDNADDIDKDLRPRLRILEQWRASEQEQRRQIIKSLDEFRALQKEIHEAVIKLTR